MYVNQSIHQPFGISVFGSSIIRVEPDVVSLNFSVSRLEQQPKDSFQKAREGTQQVRAYLAQAKVEEVGFSRINLSQEFRYVGNENRFAGYRARVSFHVLLRELVVRSVRS
jgi:hypothetical protein